MGRFFRVQRAFLRPENELNKFDKKRTSLNGCIRCNVQVDGTADLCLVLQSAHCAVRAVVVSRATWNRARLCKSHLMRD